MPSVSLYTSPLLSEDSSRQEGQRRALPLPSLHARFPPPTHTHQEQEEEEGRQQEQERASLPGPARILSPLPVCLASHSFWDPPFLLVERLASPHVPSPDQHRPLMVRTRYLSRGADRFLPCCVLQPQRQPRAQCHAPRGSLLRHVLWPPDRAPQANGRPPSPGLHGPLLPRPQPVRDSGQRVPHLHRSAQRGDRGHAELPQRPYVMVHCRPRLRQPVAGLEHRPRQRLPEQHLAPVARPLPNRLRSFDRGVPLHGLLAPLD
mmetsp:Transcript_38044/g.107469  ORF Transcript_38044/g.107469 Transcript_38044/m.107469 type:complete len:262 (-) Transcript_38044:168-953(-)